MALLLLATLRPEGVAYALLILLWRRWDRRPMPVTEAVFVLGGSVIVWWRWHYFGSVLSNVYHAKMTGGTSAYLDGIHYWLDFLIHGGGGILVTLVAVALLFSPHRKLAWLLGAAVFLQLVVSVIAGGDWMPFHRFVAPALPPLAALLAAGLAILWDGARKIGGRWRVALVLGAALAAGYVGIYKYERQQLRAVGPALELKETPARAYGRVGRWLKAQSPRSSRVAVSDVGAIGYFSERRILDMFGLVDEHIAHCPGKMHLKCDPQYVLDQHPDYVILILGGDPTDPTGILRRPDRELAVQPRFAKEYHLIREMPVPFNGETVAIYSRNRPVPGKPTGPAAGIE